MELLALIPYDSVVICVITVLKRSNERRSNPRVRQRVWHSHRDLRQCLSVVHHEFRVCKKRQRISWSSPHSSDCLGCLQEVNLYTQNKQNNYYKKNKMSLKRINKVRIICAACVKRAVTGEKSRRSKRAFCCSGGHVLRQRERFCCNSVIGIHHMGRWKVI